jgi:glycogen operon protein
MSFTTEGNEDGPPICFRGLANETYYILAEDKSRYADYTGCGHTLNANEPIVRRLIIHGLRYSSHFARTETCQSSG